MKVDLHIHLKTHMRDTTTFAAEHAQAAKAAGLDALAFTEHHRFLPLEELEALRQEHAPFVIYDGIEVTCHTTDVLVYDFRHKDLERRWRDYKSLREFVHSAGGVVCIAHPFRKGRPLPDEVREYPPDAIELLSRNTPPPAFAQILAFACEFGIPLLCNSDAHKARHIGGYYNIVSTLPAKVADLLVGGVALRVTPCP